MWGISVLVGGIFAPGMCILSLIFIESKLAPFMFYGVLEFIIMITFIVSIEYFKVSDGLLKTEVKEDS